MLTLYEELYLLALDEEKGNIFRMVRKSLPYALAGAVLTELALLGKVEAGEKSRLKLLAATPTGTRAPARAETVQGPYRLAASPRSGVAIHIYITKFGIMRLTAPTQQGMRAHPSGPKRMPPRPGAFTCSHGSESLRRRFGDW